jgi:hypothetical protein
MPTPKTRGPLKTCWLCGKRGYKWFAAHHVYTVEEQADITVDLCRGCHWLVTRLSRFKRLLDTAHKMADLITLARDQAGYPNTRTTVKYEGV